MKQTMDTCRADPQCLARYNPTRTPSFCDRILTSVPTPISRPGWTVDAYGVVRYTDADMGSGIPTSDHDAVYATASASLEPQVQTTQTDPKIPKTQGGSEGVINAPLQKESSGVAAPDVAAPDPNQPTTLTMLMVTFNCAGQARPARAQSHTRIAWAPFFDVIGRTVNRHIRAFDVVCVALQEAPESSSMADDVHAYLGGEDAYALVHKTTGAPARRKIWCIVAVRTGLVSTRHLHAEVWSRCVGGLCTKGAAAISVAGYTAFPDFCVVAMHLPFDPQEEEGAGYKKRANALMEIAGYATGWSVGGIWTCMMGDLNFRVRASGADELDTEGVQLLASLGFAEPGVPPGLTAPTCKLVPARV